MIGDVEAEHLGPSRDCLADPPQAQNPEPLAAHRGAEVHPALQPPAGAKEPLGFADPPGRHQDEGHGEISDIAGEHLGRMRDDDAAGLRGNDIGGIVADAEGGNNLEVLQPVDQVGIRPLHAPRQDAADARTDIGQQRVRIGRIDEIVQRELPLQPLDQEWRQYRNL